jgi:hypothetical protein
MAFVSSHSEEATMTRKLVPIIFASALLSVVLAVVCHLAFPDVLPYAAGEDEWMSWHREIALYLTAIAWISAEVSGLFTIVLAAYLWRKHTLTTS